MGQTLTHGIYLPDEGERNCYSGLAANWQILDSSVGTIAEHTSALAGKAPLVHTHSKADITDFPAYGNTAGTICEGNDSRLSDARTPVAHTHGKADITDLFNSANEWTDLQAYTQSIKFKVTYTIGTVPSSELYGGFNFGNSGTNMGNVTARISSGGATYSRLYIGNKFANGALDPNGSWKYAELQVGLRANGDKFIYTDCLWRNSLTPYDSNLNLGNSTNKWKSLNGINPGALSLPTTVYSDIDTTNWTLTGSTINYTPVLDGWVEINLNANASSFTRISVENAYYRHSSESQAGNQAMLTFPVRANQTYGIKLWGSSILQARFVKCEGNV